MKEHLVLDLETQREFSEVDGRRPDLLGISIVGVYSYEQNHYDAFIESDIERRLAPRLLEAELLIGFNIRRFDLAVLQPYLPYPVEELPVLDILEEVVKQLGHRVSLNSITQATFGKGKSADGLEAIRWYREGRLDLIARYCLDDVRLTKEVYDHGKSNGEIYATSRGGTEKLVIPVFWPDRKHSLDAIKDVIQEARKKCLQVEIDYFLRHAKKGPGMMSKRRVDVYCYREPFFEGLCHETGSIEQFRVENITDIRPTWKRYSVPRGFIPTIVAG